MNVVYVDTSVLVCVFFMEKHPQRSFYTDILNSADEVLSANILEAEFLSVLKREGFYLKDGLALLNSVSLIIPERSLLNELKNIFDLTFLRGADAYHLATALYVDPTGLNLKFLTLDNEQNQAAQKLEFLYELVAISPSIDEVISWVEAQDTNPDWPRHVALVLADLSARLGSRYHYTEKLT